MKEDVTSPGSAIRRELSFDSAENKVVLRSWQPNVDEVLELNSAFANQDRFTSALIPAGASMVRVASVPLIECERWRQEGLANYLDPNDRAKILAMLSSSEYQKFRTAPGRLR